MMRPVWVPKKASPRRRNQHMASHPVKRAHAPVAALMTRHLCLPATSPGSVVNTPPYSSHFKNVHGWSRLSIASLRHIRLMLRLMAASSSSARSLVIAADTGSTPSIVATSTSPPIARCAFMPRGGDIVKRPSCRQLAALEGSPPVNTMISPRSVMKISLSSTPSPASIDHVQQNSSLPPLVAAPDNGIMFSSPPTALSGRYQAFIELRSTKKKRLRYL